MTHKLANLVYLVVGCCLLSSGCTSFSSAILSRDSDGKFKGKNFVTRTAGIPVKVKVPTHVEVRIAESIFLDPSSGTVYKPVKFRSLNVETETFYSDQVFTVDIPRPFAGTLDMTADGIQLDSNGYLTSIGASIDDQTIKDITKVIGSDGFKSMIGGKATSSLLDVPANAKMSVQKNIVAVERFDVSIPGWETEMNDWIDSYMSKCVTRCPAKQCETCRLNGITAVSDSKSVQPDPVQLNQSSR